MRSPVLCLALAILLSVTGVFLQGQDTCRQDIPSDAQITFAKTFPNWRIKQLSDLESYDKQLWTKAHPKECPGLAAGHFQAPDQTSYALLLIPKSGDQASYKILVLTKSEATDAYTMKVLDHEEHRPGSGSGLVIAKVPPGKYSDFGLAGSIELKLDALEAEWIEKSSVLYYWKDGKYRALQTSD